MSDYISREQALAEVEELKKIHFDRVVVLSKVSDRIEQIPSADVRENIHGEWKVKKGIEEGYDIAGLKTWYVQIVCNKCGFIKTAIEGYTSQYNFCPNCGADMRGDT